MNETMPRPPFSTQLSGSAREAELRIRNIFSGPKKRPPLPLIILTAAVCLLCGNLVSCRPGHRHGDPVLRHLGELRRDPRFAPPRWGGE